MEISLSISLISVILSSKFELSLSDKSESEIESISFLRHGNDR